MSPSFFLFPNTVNLIKMVPGRDAAGGNVPTPALIKSGISCNVQMGTGSTQPYYDAAQERMVFHADVYFPGEGLGIEVVGGNLIASYRLTWLDNGGMLLRVLSYSEATLGRQLVWKATCEQVK